MSIMTPKSSSPARGEQIRWFTVAATGVVAAATAGAVAVDPDTSWYRSLRKPSWQPPSWAFGAVWTPLYASLVFAGGRALARTSGLQRYRLAGSLAVNLGLNAGWNWLFFRMRSPRAGLLGTALLDLSNAELIRRTARHDPVASRSLWPYAAWCAFATALNAAIVRANRPAGPRVEAGDGDVES
ncbi:TspO/MBR family protein [Streptomyces sp. NPDC048018]|uniref:TspO/MBR family protein n=1 Tax=Streptomyces sp. NPDC048018 TaxID=3365499 RepID=UPI003712573C